MILLVIFIIFYLLSLIFVQGMQLLFEVFYLEVILYFILFKNRLKRNTTFIMIYINVLHPTSLVLMIYLIIFGTLSSYKNYSAFIFIFLVFVELLGYFCTLPYNLS
jgi:hypothetical protein